MCTRPVADPTAPAQSTDRASRLILPPWHAEGAPTEGRPQEAGLMTVNASRRGVLTLGLGAVLGGIGALEANSALAAPAKYQSLWRYCHQCRGLWYSGNFNNPNPDIASGRCPGGDGHLASGRNYLLKYAGTKQSNEQRDWRHCNKCQGLWFAGSAAGPSTCPAGGAHNQSRGDYFLRYGRSTAPKQQSGWRYCDYCRGLWNAYVKNGQSICPTDRGHSKVLSGNYNLFYK